MTQAKKKENKPTKDTGDQESQKPLQKGDDSKMAVWMSAIRSFYDGSVYRQATQVKIGQVLKVFFVVVFVFQFAFSAYTIWEATTSLEQMADEIGDDLPTLELRDGILSTYPEQVYKWQTREGLFAIDTSGDTSEIDDLVDADVEQAVVVTDRKILVKENKYSTRTFDLSALGNDLTLDKSSLDSFVNVVKIFMIAGLALYMFLAPLLNLLQAAIVALIVYSLRRLMRSQLGYQAVFRIAVIASLPTFLLTLLQGNVLGLNIPWFSFFVLVAYCYFGMISQEDK